MRKKVLVEYVDSGAFQGGESDVYDAGIKSKEECYVIRKSDYDRVHKELREFRRIDRLFKKGKTK